ncbi:MAG: AI-2E family transporter [Bacteroidales bacterium]|nr:AI-2E family transporter [Bacteroidales bacterium]
MEEYKFPLFVKLPMVLLTIVLTVFIMITAKSVLVPVLISGMLAVLISPLASWMEKKGLPRLLAVFLSVIALLGFLFGLAYFFYNQIIGFADELFLIEKRISELLLTINEFTEKHIEGAVPISFDNIQNAVFNYLYDNMASLTQGVIATATTLTIAFIIPIYIFLFLYFRHFLIEFIHRAFSEKDRLVVTRVVHKVKEVVQNYIVGMFVVIIILAVLNSITLYSFGLRHALLFAVFAAMLNVIPFLGPFIGATLPIVYAFLTKDSLWYPFGIFAAFYVIQLAESNIFTPRIVGGKVSMNPFMTILALLLGNFIWGLAGMILFIPGMAMLKVVFDEIDGMQPYGFLLGSTRPKKAGEDHRRTLAERLKQLSLKKKP